MAESPGNADDHRPADEPPSGPEPSDRGPAAGWLHVHRQGLLVAAVVLAVGSGISAAGAGGASGSAAGLRDAAAAGAAGSSTAPFSVPAAAAVLLPATPVHVDTPAPADPTAITGLAANGIPTVALNAYRVAADRMNATLPSCGIDWSLLAGIGRVESNHGRFAGAVLNSDGTSSPKIVGPPLDGVQFALITDSDDGRWDGDRAHDRAVGPMQFIPATWRAYGIDADGSGAADPLDIDDAALAAAHYLCLAGGDLRTDAGRRRAVLAYNHSDSYVDQVLALAAAYAAGIPVADLSLVGDTTSPVPEPSGNYRGPAAPGPAIGAGDSTPSADGEAAVPAPPPPSPAADSAGGTASAEGPSGGGTGGGTGGSTGGGTATETGTGTGGDGGAVAPADPAPSVPTHQATEPVLPAPLIPAVPLPDPGDALPPVPLPVPCLSSVLGQLLPPGCTPG